MNPTRSSESLKLPPPGETIPDHFFRAIAESTVDWESWHSDSGKVLWVNQAVEEVTGYSPSECLEMPDYPMPLIAAEDRERMARKLQSASEGSTEKNVEFRVLHRNGSVLWMAVSWQPMVGANETRLGFRASIRDVTEKRQLREQLRLQNEHLEQLVLQRTEQVAELEKHRAKMQQLAALGELAAGVAHEINNPLAGIRNALLLIKRSLSSEIRHFDKFELIDREIDRISGITHQMYQLYRPSQQEPSPFSIRQTLDEVVSLSQPLSRKQKVKVEVEFEEGEAVDELQWDEVVLREGELKQVLLNLVHNAIQASSAGQSVEVGVKALHSIIVIDVVDHGHGIAPEHQSKIFDPFFSTKTESVGQGMGLGLSVTRSLVEAMKGAVHVETEVGQGTHFQVILPRRLCP